MSSASNAERGTDALTGVGLNSLMDSPVIVQGITGCWNGCVAPPVANRRVRHETQGNHTGPHGQSVVRRVVFHIACAYLCGNFRQWQLQDAGGFQFLVIWSPRIVPTAG